MHCFRKILSLQCLNSTESPDGQRLGRHNGKGVFVRFGFDELESRKFIDKSRTKQQRTPHEVYDVQPSLTSITLVVVVRVFLYTYTGVGLSALLVSTCRAMREPQFVERVTEVAPRFFICRLTFCEIRQYGSRWQKNYL